MTMTAAQRRKVARANAQKSTGPRDTSSTRFNALKHGLCARVAVLPGEDPELIQARAEEWYDFFQPRGPAERHLLYECVQASIESERGHAFHAAVVSKQVRDADAFYDS